MKFEIKHRLTGAVIFAAETESLKACVQLAVKSRARLDGANFPDSLVIDTGETWQEYREYTVPALLEAGGHPVGKSAWGCYSWENCPMAQAFGVHEISQIPILYRPRVKQFIRFFDARLLPAPATLVND